MTDPVERLTVALEGRYTVERELGEGGMATVYLAEDLRHHRKVAVKVLRAELAAVLGADRFLKEIEVTANLQHPHILPLFDSGEADGIPYYVMPFITGETLRDRLDRETQLSIEESIEITRAVASALDYAHRHEVVHRDIKPANILLQDGQPIVADFGIALAVSAAGGRRLTETGLSVGTPEYMSPEQASGLGTIDARADVYALASVTYEMLLGEPPHTGPTAQAVIAKIMTEDPRRITLARNTVPSHVEFAVHRGLAKLPADRFTTAADFADALTNPDTRDTWVGSIPSLVRRPQIKRWATRATVIALAGLGAWGWLRPTPDVTRRLARFELPYPSSEASTAARHTVAISPDGSYLAYVVRGAREAQLYLRALDELESRVVLGSRGALDAFFSPDGQWLGFATVTGFMKVPVTGGTPTRITDASDPRGAVWGEDDQVIFGSTSGLWTVSASGGDARQITALDGDLMHSRPARLPGADAVVFTSLTADEEMQVAVASLATGEVTPLFQGLAPRYMETGHLLYGRPDGVLMAVEFDADRHAVTGAPVPLLEGLTTRALGSMDFAVSANASLVYLTGAVPSGQLVLVDRRGVETPLIDTENTYWGPRFSPDGRRLTVGVGVPPTRQAWVYEMDARTMSPLTFEGHNYYPVWNHDGTRMVFSNETPNGVDLRWKPADGTGGAEVLLATGQLLYPSAWSSDGAHLVFREQDSTTQSDLWVLPLESRVPRRLFDLPSREDAPDISPDGRWLAFGSDLSGQYEVYVTTFPEPGARTQVSVAGGSEPVWSRDGRELFYRRGAELIAATVETGERFRVSDRQVLFASTHAPWDYHSNYDAHPDGQRFVMIKNMDGASRRLVVVLNWGTEMERAMREE